MGCPITPRIISILKTLPNNNSTFTNSNTNSISTSNSTSSTSTFSSINRLLHRLVWLTLTQTLLLFKTTIQPCTLLQQCIPSSLPSTTLATEVLQESQRVRSSITAQQRQHGHLNKMSVCEFLFFVFFVYMSCGKYPNLVTNAGIKVLRTSARFNASRSFDIEDDIEFCPLMTDDDVSLFMILGYFIDLD